MHPKPPELVRALDGRFGVDHAAQLRQLLDHIDWLDAAICDLDQRIEQLTADHTDVITRLATIPGTGRRTAEVIVAETGPDMTRFPSSAHLASWAGLCPGHNESGGKRRSGRTPSGDVWLADALVEAAWAGIRSSDYLTAKFRRVAGPKRDDERRKKAAVAVAHKLLIFAYAIMATPGEAYRELGSDWFTRHDDPERRKARLIAQFHKLGYEVTLTPAA